MIAAIAFARRNETAITAIQRFAAVGLLFAAVGVELAVLATWLPDTLGSWLNPDKNGYGDFPLFYRNAETFSLNALYSPGLAVLMHPLTYVGQRPAFAIYVAVNIAALCGVAFLAQRGVGSVPAKVAIALAIFALPQTHWAIRIGHFTEILALAALGGLLLSDRRPVAAGLCIAALALKPQYLPVPLLYLAFTRNWRALATVFGAFAVLGIAGVAAAALRDPSGIRMFLYTGDYYAHRIPEAWTFLTAGQRDQAYPQGWQYSWYGFLLSIGVQPNPLIAGDLMLLTLGAVVVVWWKCTLPCAKVATALGMLLLAPHSSFYNWSMLSVAAALLLRCDLRPRALVPVLLVTMGLAAAASQNATPFPLPYDAYRPASTLGIYWVQPVALASIVVLAFAGRRRTMPVDESPVPAQGISLAIPTIRSGFVPTPALAMIGVTAMLVGAMATAFVSGTGPFRRDADFSRGRILAALPADFPVPPQSDVEDAGPGTHYPYRIEWQTPARTSDVLGLMRVQLDDGTWQVVNGDDAGATLRSTRRTTNESAPIIAEVRVEPDGEGSRVHLEFSPLPSSSVPGYARWLQHIGLVVHSIDPNSPEALVTPTH